MTLGERIVPDAAPTAPTETGDNVAVVLELDADSLDPSGPPADGDGTVYTPPPTIAQQIAGMTNGQIAARIGAIDAEVDRLTRAILAIDAKVPAANDALTAANQAYSRAAKSWAAEKGKLDQIAGTPGMGKNSPEYAAQEKVLAEAQKQLDDAKAAVAKAHAALSDLVRERSQLNGKVILLGWEKWFLADALSRR